MHLLTFGSSDLFLCDSLDLSLGWRWAWLCAYDTSRGESRRVPR